MKKKTDVSRIMVLFWPINVIVELGICSAEDWFWHLVARHHWIEINRRYREHELPFSIRSDSRKL